MSDPKKNESHEEELLTGISSAEFEIQIKKLGEEAKKNPILKSLGTASTEILEEVREKDE